MSSSRRLVEKISFTLRLMFPEAFLRICRKASASPCTSAMKCSVPLGRLRIASRLMISVAAAEMLPKFCDRSSRTRRSDSIFDGVKDDMDGVSADMV